MTTQSTQCADEELAELEEWLQSKGLSHAESSGSGPVPGEYTKKLDTPEGSSMPVWTVTWCPREE